jgi:uncharacterized membrane protein
MRLKWLSSVFVLAFFATSAMAAPQVRYRLHVISSPLLGGLSPTGMNNRGEVVGTRAAPDGESPFVWRDGAFVDLRSRITPAASYIEATGINDRSQIVGFYLDPDTSVFRGFLLDRDRVSNLQGPLTAEAVFMGRINDREQIFGSFYDAEHNEASFINDQGRVRLLEPSFVPTDINVSGALSGTRTSEGESRAAIWEDGLITPIAPTPSRATSINDRGQVVGVLTGAVVRAFAWERGRLTVLPALLDNQPQSWVSDVNNSGRIVGETSYNQPDRTVQIATVWDNGQVTDLNTLIRPDDPLRAFVTLVTAMMINDRGEIVARGTDSRAAGLQIYFLEPVRGQ